MRKFDLFGKDDLVWSGNSVFEPSGPFFPRSPNLEMMGQDAGASIYSQCRQKHERGGRRFSSVSFGFEPEDNAVINSFRTLVGGRSDDIDYNIAQFLDMIARTIVVENRFVYELQVGRDKNTHEIVKMNFSPVSAPDDKVLVCGRHVVQILSSSVAERYGCSRVRRLNHSVTFVFEGPKRWRRVLIGARSAVRLFDTMEYRSMDQLAKSMATGYHAHVSYDHSSNLRMVSRETARLGWSGRWLFHGYETDYAGVERLIRWNRFCIDLRNYMIRELERAVHSIADMLNSKCRLIAQENSEYTLDDVRKKLQEGKTSTVELMKLLF